MTEPLDDAMDDLRYAIRNDIRGGYTPAEDIVESALDVVDDLGDDARERMRPMAEHLMRVESEAFLRDQATWPDVTDCDRLDRAFEELERRGIVARQDFSCCMNCGSGEVWTEVDEAVQAGRPVRGHTFFHAQDTEGAAEGGELYLAYGAIKEEGIAEIGREIVSVLQAQGLATEWDGSPDNRIRVDLDWKRRRDDL